VEVSEGEGTEEARTPWLESLNCVRYPRRLTLSSFAADLPGVAMAAAASASRVLHLLPIQSEAGGTSSIGWRPERQTVVCSG
jgi:hypothetical protein